jgi:hypothetical protein
MSIGCLQSWESMSVVAWRHAQTPDLERVIDVGSSKLVAEPKTTPGSM